MSVTRSSSLLFCGIKSCRTGSAYGKQLLKRTTRQKARYQSIESRASSPVSKYQHARTFRKVDIEGKSPPPKAQQPATAKPGARSKPPYREWLAIARNLADQGSLLDPNTGQLIIDSRQLRNACTCKQCVHPADRQRNYHWAEIPSNIQVESHEVDDKGTYTVHWKHDVPGFKDHVSTYTKQDIIAAAGLKKGHGHSIHQIDRLLWDKSSFDMKQSTLSYADFMTTPRGLAVGLHRLMVQGLLFIEDVPEDEESVARLAERIGPLRNTFYGRTWDVRSVADAKNVAYTSRNLGYHMDLLYMAEPPGLQLLHCLENTCEGGLSRFADTLKALDNLMSKGDPMILSKLASSKVAYEYNNDGSYYYDQKPIVSYKALPAVRRDVWNARFAEALAHVQRVYWSPPFAAPHMAVSQNDSEERAASAKAFADVLEEEKMTVTTKLPPGTCAIFDNLRVVHARTAFDTSSGHRWLKGAYVNHQDFWSKATAMEKELLDIQSKEQVVRIRQI